MKLALFAAAIVAGITASPAYADELTLKEMLQDALRRTQELADQVRAADLRARGELGTNEISTVPVVPDNDTHSTSTGNAADRR